MHTSLDEFQKTCDTCTADLVFYFENIPFMNITYLGHLSVSVKGKDSTVVFNPFDKSIVGFNFKKTDADIVLSSDETPECCDYSKVPEDSYKVTSPGEYEVKGVMALGYPLMEKESEDSEKMVNHNTIYRVEFEGVNICHLGALKRKLTDKEIDLIGSVDVLVLPVGNDKFVDSKVAAEVVNKIEPAIVVPVAYHDDEYVSKYAELSTAEKFLEAMGASKPETESYLKVKKSDIDSEGEGTRVVILERKS